MVKIDIISGFLGAGKTTLIRKIIKEALQNTQVVLIENEFGEIGIDSGFLKEAGIEIKEMNSGCICCSLVGDFGASLKEVIEKYHPERILIEPSGVGKLSDVVKAVNELADGENVVLNSAAAVVDAVKSRMYLKNFGEFFENQISHAGTIILSRTGNMKKEKLEACVEMLRQYNEQASMITTPWEDVTGQAILHTMERKNDLEKVLMEELQGDHLHHQKNHGEGCTCGCHDHEGHECGGHDHEGHECGGHDHEGHECGGHDHEGHECGGHGHDHGEGCGCGCHGHHHNHDAEEVFASWGTETVKEYRKEELEHILGELEDEKKYGMVLRAKGILPSQDGEWVYFDYVPGETNIRYGEPEVTGKVCVIGSGINNSELTVLFGL